MLVDELKELGNLARPLADAIGVPPNRLYQLISGKRADRRYRLARYFGGQTNAGWNVQKVYELDLARKRLGPQIKKIRPPARRRHGVSFGVDDRFDAHLAVM